MSSSTSSTTAAAPAVNQSYSIHESTPSEIPAIKKIITEWLNIANQRHTAEFAVAKNALKCRKLNESQRTFLGTLDSSRKTIFAMIKYLNERGKNELPHLSTRIITCRDSTHTHAVAIFETIGNQLMYIAANPNNLHRNTEEAPTGKEAATEIIYYLAEQALASNRSITVFTSGFAQPYFLKFGFEPYLSDQDYKELQVSIRKWNGLPQDHVLKPQRSLLSQDILLLPLECYLVLTPEKMKELFTDC